MGDQGYRRVPGLKNFIKSYIRGGRATKNTDGYLVSKSLPSPTYRVDGRPRVPIGTLPEVMFSHAYKVNRRLRILTDTWSKENRTDKIEMTTRAYITIVIKMKRV